MLSMLHALVLELCYTALQIARVGSLTEKKS